jgi:curved DNA-binding protein CbpA
MRPLSEQDHYEILEIPRETPQREIERAYELAQATYAEDSLAGYSIFAEGDAEAMRERIETAYRVLSDEESRRAYDGSLADSGAPPEPASPWLAEPEALAASAEPLAPQLPAEVFEEFDDDSGAFDGARMRRSRLRRGMEIEDVARVTKVNPTYVRFIEEERFADLPARVYVRGFVGAYASCVGLDPRRVADSYMQRFDRESPKEPRVSKRA